MILCRDLLQVVCCNVLSIGVAVEGCRTGEASISRNERDQIVSQPDDATYRGVSADELRVTSGRAEPNPDGSFRIRDAVTRLLIGTSPRQGLRAIFRYAGPTAVGTPLASGEVRTQVALKLRAQDSCNVVYVAWRAAPDVGIRVSVKSNPGAHLHQSCGDRGYSFVLPTRASNDVNGLTPGEEHALSANISGDMLYVRVDGRFAWEGELPPTAMAFDGPVGFRTDNARVDVTFLVPP